MADKSTPTPWRLETEAGVHRIMGENDCVAFFCVYGRGEGLQKFVDEGKANAALIVRAVNHHEELVTALQNLMEDYEDNTVGDLGDDDLNVPSVLKDARALLAKVKDEGHG